VALTSCLLIVVVMFLFARRFRSDAYWWPFALPTLVWVTIAVGAFLLIPILGDGLFGVSERVFVGSWVSWLLPTAIRPRLVGIARPSDNVREGIGSECGDRDRKQGSETGIGNRALIWAVPG